MEARKSPSEELLDLLQSEGAIDRALADRVRLRLGDSWVPIGKILRQKGWITMGQLMELLNLQAANPSLRIGELALQRGYCTLAQIESALQIQHELSPHVLDMLTEQPGIAPEALLRTVTRYVRALETRIGFARLEPGESTGSSAPR